MLFTIIKLRFVKGDTLDFKRVLLSLHTHQQTLLDFHAIRLKHSCMETCLEMNVCCKHWSGRNSSSDEHHQDKLHTLNIIKQILLKFICLFEMVFSPSRAPSSLFTALFPSSGDLLVELDPAFVGVFASSIVDFTRCFFLLVLHV